METTLQPKLFNEDTKPVDIDTEESPKLTNGWYDTMKYGPVFVNHGEAWAVQIIGDRLVNVIVELSSKDIIGRSAIEKMKDNAAYKARRQVRRGK